MKLSMTGQEKDMFIKDLSRRCLCRQYNVTLEINDHFSYTVILENRYYHKDQSGNFLKEKSLLPLISK
jgi:hypothetical protein